MPPDHVAGMVALLPEEVVRALCILVAESAGWAESDWKRVRFIGEPQPGEEDVALLRQKHGALRSHFSADDHTA